MERCDPLKEGGCPLAEVCAEGSVGAMLGRASIRYGSYCDERNEGRICGPATAYYEAALCANTIRELDAESPWTHTARIMKAPDGEAPEEIRDSLVGLKLPVRANLQPTEEADIVAVHPLDFLLTLDEAGLLKEAQWYRKYTGSLQEKGQHLEVWHFNADELEVTDGGRESTLGQYGLSVWHKPLLGSIWTGFVLNPSLFTAKGDRNGDELFERLQEVADEEYEGDVSVAIARRIVFATLEHNSFAAASERGPGRSTTFDHEGNVIRVVDPGAAVVYDEALGIDHRDNPQEAVALPARFPAEEPFVQIAPWKSYPIADYFDKP